MKSKEWLILNAVECWLHYYSTPNTPTVEQYKELRKEILATWITPKSEPKPKTTRKRSSTKSSDDPISTTETV
jgi:hypothetical protein